ncbi:uncharacterized protein LOC119301223 isoform X1 [Triticum dicoccoides]|uniref:uncharacterized protein LOC119301223 isoform X1 n=1 Tax=Triticum dicoccoides TaxID=85692 RepID=UPI000E7A9C58|nr:uncharacterized protein LOC119301223 isoform X1 [Triticum dicoccoides]XP_044380958.1 uncharacterized protein LOC123103434 isoform X1 [Triticum aestivum]
MSTSRSPWKPRSPRSILIVTTGNDYKRKTHKVSEIRRGWGRSCVAAPGGSIYSARRMLSKMSIAQGQGATRWAKKAEVWLQFPDAQQRCGAHMHNGGATAARCTEVVVMTLRGDCGLWRQRTKHGSDS